MGTTVGILLVMNFTCICIGIAGIVAGGIGHSWWKTENSLTKNEQGLWRSCITSGADKDSTVCGTSRDHVLKFTAAESKFYLYQLSQTSYMKLKNINLLCSIMREVSISKRYQT